jgi:hypothetical protein
MFISIKQLPEDCQSDFMMALYSATYLADFREKQFGSASERATYMQAWEAIEANLRETGEAHANLIWKRSPSRDRRGREFQAFQDDWNEVLFAGGYRQVLDMNGKLSDEMVAR